MRLLIAFALFCLPFPLIAQMSLEQQAVRTTIDEFFLALQKADTTSLHPLFSPDIRIGSALIDQNGREKIQWVNRSALMLRLSPWPEEWKEALWNYDIRIDGPLASVWTEYTFFRDTSVSHCGANSFLLEKTSGRWRILHLIDSRRSTDCQVDRQADQEAVNKLLDNWHQAAAKADSAAYFGAMPADGIFLGTDASERWTRDEFADWAQGYFAKQETWDFKPISRTLYFAADHSIGWFEETLDTWMGTCRGSGVVQKTGSDWKLAHYNLAITVPNEVVSSYLKLLDQTKEE